MSHKCANCDEIWDDGEIDEIPTRLYLNMEAGDTVPSGVCPACGACVFLYSEQEVFVEGKGNHCPYCCSKNIMQLAISSECFSTAGYAYVATECHDCGRLWSEKYELVGFVDEGEQEEEPCREERQRKQRKPRRKKQSSRT